MKIGDLVTLIYDGPPARCLTVYAPSRRQGHGVGPMGIVLHEQAISGTGIDTGKIVGTQYEVLWCDGSHDWNWRQHLSKVSNENR